MKILEPKKRTWFDLYLCTHATFLFSEWHVPTASPRWYTHTYNTYIQYMHAGHYIATSVGSPIQIIRSSYFHGHECRHSNVFYKYWWGNGSLSGAQWIPSWNSYRIPPAQQVQSWNFLLNLSQATVNCMETFGNGSNSATKRSAK